MPFPNIGAPELIIILIIVLIAFGPGKLPDVAASLGKSVREFRRAATDVSEAAKLEPTKPAAGGATAAAAPTPLSPTGQTTQLATPASPPPAGASDQADSSAS